MPWRLATRLSRQRLDTITGHAFAESFAPDEEVVIPADIRVDQPDQALPHRPVRGRGCEGPDH